VKLPNKFDGLQNKKFTARGTFAWDVVDSKSEPDFVYREKLTGRVVDENTENAIKYRRFWGYISTPEVDFYDTIVTKSAVVNAFPAYIKNGNSRLMHTDDLAGRIFPGDYEIREKGVYAGVSIPIYKEEVLRDIDACLLNGYSLGFTIDNWETVEYDETRDIMIFHSIRIAEVSVVDAGATPDTNFMEERTKSDKKLSLLDKLKSLISNEQGESPKTKPTEEKSMFTKGKDKPDTPQDEVIKELLSMEHQSIVDEVKALNETMLGEVRTMIADAIKPQEPEKKVDEPKGEDNVIDLLRGIQTAMTDNKKAIDTKFAEIEKEQKNVRQTMGTDEVLDVEARATLDQLIEYNKARMDEMRSKNPVFMGGLIRSKQTGGVVENGLDLLGGI